MNKSKSSRKSLIFIVIGVIGLWIISGLVIYLKIDNWSDRGTFGDMFGAINSLFSGLALVGIVYSIFLQISTTKSDHERRKKEATINYLNLIRPKYKTLLRECEKELGVDVISQDLLSTIMENEDLRNSVKDYLSTIEHLSVGINTGVFDKDILYRMSASYLITMFYRFKPYIDNVQKTLPSAYAEFEHLVKEFENQRKSLPTQRGTIRN